MTSRGELEVAGQRVADVLGVALLGERREADEVGEEDRDEAALGEGRLGRARPRAARDGGLCGDPVRERRRAFAAEAHIRFVGGPARWADQLERCRAPPAELPPGWFSVPQL